MDVGDSNIQVYNTKLVSKVHKQEAQHSIYTFSNIPTCMTIIDLQAWLQQQ